MSSSTQRYADLLRLMPCAGLLVDDGVIQSANREAVEAMGLPLGHLVGTELSELLVPEMARQAAQLLDEASLDPATASVRLGESLTPVELTARLLCDDLVVVGIRTMAQEYHYSALATADLTHDPLTGFANRYHLLSLLGERLQTSHRSPVALIGLWIDDLAEVTATHGQRASQRVIKEVSTRLQTRLRSPDVLGRYGDAGFVAVLTSDAPVSQLTGIAERLRDEVAFPVELDNGLVSFSATVVVASLGGRRPPLERVMNELDSSASRAVLEGGARTEILEL